MYVQNTFAGGFRVIAGAAGGVRRGGRWEETANTAFAWSRAENAAAGVRPPADSHFLEPRVTALSVPVTVDSPSQQTCVCVSVCE